MSQNRSKIIVTTSFDSAHSVFENMLTSEPLHGHSWNVIACWEMSPGAGQSTPVECGLVLERAVKNLDHSDLNKNPLLENIAPTAEHLAVFLFDTLRDSIDYSTLMYIKIEEEPGSWASYYGSN
jgi:6-pyruvoyl-tetrahydropterin synthase